MCVLPITSESVTAYLIPRFVDSDMIMRFRGGGFGHKSTLTATDYCSNHDELDIRDDVMYSLRGPAGDAAPIHCSHTTAVQQR